jgi:hypothetical protein
MKERVLILSGKIYIDGMLKPNFNFFFRVKSSDGFLANGSKKNEFGIS